MGAGIDVCSGNKGTFRTVGPFYPAAAWRDQFMCCGTQSSQASRYSVEKGSYFVNWQTARSGGTEPSRPDKLEVNLFCNRESVMNPNAEILDG
jgi:hypothetical protein